MKIDTLVKCPVCDGWGERAVWREWSATGNPDIVECHSCKGTGVFSFDLHFGEGVKGESDGT